MITLEEEKFALEFLRDHNVKQAAIRCGHPEDDAWKVGRELIDRPVVIEFLQDEISARRKRMVLTVDRIVLEYAAIAFTRISDIASFDEDGVKLKPSEEVPESALAAIAEISDTRTGPRIKMASKLEALSTLGKHLGMFDSKFASQEQDEGLDLSKLSEEELLKLQNLTEKASGDKVVSFAKNRR